MQNTDVRYDHITLRRSMQDIVASLGLLSAESTAAVSPALERLQILQTLGEAWCLRWPALAATSASDPSAASRQADLDAVQLRWRQRERLAGVYTCASLTARTI